MTTQEAADRAGKSINCIKYWCETHGLGRKVGGEWHISRVAFEMFLESDKAALDLYHMGARAEPTVARYYAMFDL